MPKITLTEITYDPTSGKVRYPCPAGFQLDHDLVVQVADGMECRTGAGRDLAMRLAVWTQLAAYEEACASGAAAILARCGRPPALSPLMH